MLATKERTRSKEAQQMAPAPKKTVDDSTYLGRFAVRLRMLREKAGKTVEQLAEEVGVPVRTYYNWEQGNAVPHLRLFPELAKAYGLKTSRAILPDE